MRTADRRAALGIGEGRADILVAGARILVRILERVACERVQVSGWGLRHGLALAAGLAGDPRRDAQLARRLALLQPTGRG
jgi:exopolyphosphatase/pppGpp-phosphohydrolase